MAEPSVPRALVVGAGATSNLIHLPLLARLRDRGRLSLQIICDLEPARAKAARRRFNFAESCSDAHTALARPDIDLVYVFGTAQMHYDYGLQALAEGKHLFVEKPVAPSYAEALHMVQAARKAGRIAVGGHNRRFQDAMRLLRQKRSRWQMAEAVFHKPEHGKPVPFGAADWLWANGIHTLDALLFLMGGAPSHISAAAQGQCFSALMRWSDGAQATFTCNNQAGARREEYRLHVPGETAHLKAKGLIVERDGRASRPLANSDGFAEEHEAFLAAILDGTPPAHALAELAPALHLAELIRAVYTGPVVLPAAPMVLRSAQVAASVLVVQPRQLQQALAPLLPHRLVAPEDVTGPRPDIVAAVMGRPELLSSALLDRLPNLSFVAVAGLSLHRMQPATLEARGITLANASRAYANSVAEFALGLAILGRRCAFSSHRVMQEGGWGADPAQIGLAAAAKAAARRIKPLAAMLRLERPLVRSWQKVKPVLMPGSGVLRDLAGATVGLVGWGANARAFTQRLVASGARVLVWSEKADPAEIVASGAQVVPLCQALAAEIVSLHRALTPQTRHCLAQAELDQLRPGAVLINVARAALIEPKALLTRLQRGDIFACLDTFEEEPPPRRHPLRRLPNVFLTSHIAGGSPDMHHAAAREAVARLCEHLGCDLNADRRNVSR